MPGKMLKKDLQKSGKYSLINVYVVIYLTAINSEMSGTE